MTKTFSRWGQINGFELKLYFLTKDRIEMLYIDCVWNCARELEVLHGIEDGFDLINSLDQGEV